MITTISEPLIVDIPPAPQTIEAAGVSFDLVMQLVAKTLHFSGGLAGTELALRLGVPFSLVEPCLELMKRERHVEITGGGLLGPPSYRYRLTESGHARAGVYFEQNQYVGYVPVPLDQYMVYMREFRRTDPLTVTRDAVRRAFSHLVLSDRVLDQLGPAIAARHSLFIYGPPGNGKTVISQGIGNLLTGDIGIPHALDVEGHIVRLFDPVNHLATEPPAAGDTLEQSDRTDRRWVRCRRPLVTVGGELTLDALELGSTGNGFYRAPLQAISNGGVLVIDDFGRQQVAPTALLNRWIVPLESRVDFLTLRTGQKFELPFDVLVVFATNIKPAELVDEAFLRRIQYKVLAESPTAEDFIRIFENYCHTREVPFSRRIVQELLETELRPRAVALRGCQPRDLIEHALSLASYLGQPRALTLDLLASACDTYFVDESANAAA